MHSDDLEKVDDHYYQQIVTQELGRFNWGAFGFTWFWALFNGVTLDFWKAFGIALAFGVGVGFSIHSPLSSLAYLLFSMYVGFKGNEFAWFRNNDWGSIDKFNDYQKKWAIAYLIYFIFTGPLIYLLLIPFGLYANKALTNDIPISTAKTAIESLVKAPEFKEFNDGFDVAKFYSNNAGEECKAPTLVEGDTVACDLATKHKILLKYTKLADCALDKYSCNVFVSVVNGKNVTKIALWI